MAVPFYIHCMEKIDSDRTKNILSNTFGPLGDKEERAEKHEHSNP